ncbi:hypothetical protein [Natronobacterium gregoryi]|nr:hypothetical protein [Natronobacterium gregoryi]
MNLPPKDAPTPIERIDETLEAQEKSVTNMHDEYGYAMVNISEIQEPE